MRNQGVELELSWRDNIGKVNYGVSMNASYNAIKLLKWNEFIARGSTSSGANIFLGLPYDFIYTYEDIGIAQTWQDVYNATPQGIQPGDIIRKDLNGDGRIDGNDRVAYKNTLRNRPNTYFALNSFAAWKGFDIVVFVQGSAGRKDYWINAFNNPNFSNQRYASTWSHWEEPWTPENREGAWPRLGGSGNNTLETSYWLDDMSYIRLKNIQLGYNLPKSLLKKVGIYSLRIAGSAENLGTITSYRGLDPEKAGSNNNLYPINKSYSISINMGF